MDVWPHLVEYATAFRRLSAGRGWASGGLGGSAPMRITEMEKEAYARARMGITAPSVEYDRFCWLIDAQDDAFMKHHAKKSKRSAGNGEEDASREIDESDDEEDEE